MNVIVNELSGVPMPANEQERQAELNSLSILDTLPEKEYDQLVKLVSDICQTPMSAVTLIDGHRQWFKAEVGLGVCETSREVSFCAHAIASPSDIFIVPDATKDIRFSENPFVVNGAVNFYAGVPLVTKNGHALGSLCVIDNKPRTLEKWQMDALKTIAAQVVSLFELRKANADLSESKLTLTAKNDELKKFAYTVTHDIKSPANNLLTAASILQSDFGVTLGESGGTLLSYLVNSSTKIKNLVDGVLAYYTSDELLAKKSEEIDLSAFLHQMAEFISINENIEFIYPKRPVQ